MHLDSTCLKQLRSSSGKNDLQACVRSDADDGKRMHLLHHLLSPEQHPHESPASTPPLWWLPEDYTAALAPLDLFCIQFYNLT